MIAWIAAAWAATGTVDAVVVFPDRAEVDRVLRVELVAGLNEIAFEDLPPTLDESSLQAEGAGVEGARILGIDVRSRELVEDRRARVAELEASLQAARDELQVAQDQKAAAQAEIAFLERLSAAAAQQLSAELLFAEGAPADADAVAALLRVRIPEAQEAMRAAAQAERDVRARLAALQRELDTTRGMAQWSRRDVVVLVEAPEAGSAALHLSYILPGASWTPTWDARASGPEGTLGLVMHALVVQTTGEDWSDVALTLSTARPAAGLSPPGLAPHWLEPPAPVYAYEDYGYDAMPEAAAAYEDEDMGAGPAPPPPPPAEPMAVATATVTERAVASTFEVPSRANVPGDGTRKKLRVIEVELPARYVHVAVPRAEASAFLVARADWTAGWPLLAGRVASFVGDAFVGMTSTPTVGQGGELEIAFGRDDAVRVESEQLEWHTGAPSFGRVTARRSWRHTVTNGRKDPVTLEIVDRIPVSRHARYKVRYEGDPPTEQTADGKLTFVRELAGGGETTALVAYTVRWPKRNPPGEIP